MAITAGILLSLYLLLILALTRTSPTESDKARSTARGCRHLFALPVLAVGALLAAGLLIPVPWMVAAAFWISLTPFYLMVLGWISQWLQHRRIARQNRDNPPT